MPDLTLGVQVAAPPGATAEKEAIEPLVALGLLGASLRDEPPHGTAKEPIEPLVALGASLSDEPLHGTANRFGHRTESQHEHRSPRQLTPEISGPPTGASVVSQS
jgi:hypothetical protein